MNSIEIFVPYAPPSANRIWRQNYQTGRTYLSRTYVEFERVVATALAGRRLPDDWRYCAVEIVVRPNRRVGDVDNRIKAVLDALTKGGFWRDDRCVAEICCRFGNVDKSGSVTVKVTKRDEKFPS